ncbi:cytochrome c-type biogenesis protein CcmH [Aggregicoccus sp. 17bor-14]|uniref:cytochrome c-type biogenesis protein n=1 Tax=Myxococcaceae TaxID=31 RepID=UPI00129C6D1C|nr:MULTISPECIES: cytochrome c-type biogenesis protein [Myxococcaceae]MBF5041089.1 cytochrome c-type biogenesis protein CcmH [Simulacricoccus sp. 17bor-14]MRI86876.1 cytochrome c-type biogenesis protein CcmH [Aggregicoccus sp. 17bor-14]
MSLLLPLTLALGLAAGQYAPQQAGSQPLAPPLEQRVQKLGKELRCAVCQGLSITDSPSSMARAQLDKVRELVSEGKNDQEVRDYFVARYGEWVLLQPKAEGFNLFVWLGPGVLLLVGAFVILRQVRRAPEPAAAPHSPSSTPVPAEAEDPYLQAVRRDLER